MTPNKRARATAGGRGHQRSGDAGGTWWSAEAVRVNVLKMLEWRTIQLTGQLERGRRQRGTRHDPESAADAPNHRGMFVQIVVMMIAGMMDMARTRVVVNVSDLAVSVK